MMKKYAEYLTEAEFKKLGNLYNEKTIEFQHEQKYKKRATKRSLFFRILANKPLFNTLVVVFSIVIIFGIAPFHRRAGDFSNYPPEIKLFAFLSMIILFTVLFIIHYKTKK